LNWTEYKAEDKPFHWSVFNNAAGLPDLIYYGGYGKNYNNYPWREYVQKKINSSYYQPNRGQVSIFLNFLIIKSY
jgi:hypothetical protein